MPPRWTARTAARVRRLGLGPGRLRVGLLGEGAAPLSGVGAAATCSSRSRPRRCADPRLLRHPDRLGDWHDRGPASLAVPARRRASDDEIIPAFQELEEPLCEPPYRPYKELLAGVVEGFGRRFDFPVGATERDLLAASIPSWRPFPDTVDALRTLARRYRLAVASNIDDDLFAATARQLRGTISTPS